MHELRKRLLTCECSHKWVIQGELFIKLLKRYLQLCKYAVQYDYLSQLKTVYITRVCKWKSSLSEQAVVVNQMSMSQSRKPIKWQHIAQISACACQSQKLIIWQHIAHIRAHTSACQIWKLMAWYCNTFKFYHISKSQNEEKSFSSVNYQCIVQYLCIW